MSYKLLNWGAPPNLATTYGEILIFMDDNARPHRDRIIRDWFNDHGIDYIDWPSLLPDMNPIEHAWDQLKERIRAHPEPSLTVNDRRSKAVRLWSEMDQNSIDNLIKSMPR